MWQTKTFKTASAQTKWIAANINKYWIEIIFINNGYAVEYKKLIVII